MIAAGQSLRPPTASVGWAGLRGRDGLHHEGMPVDMQLTSVNLEKRQKSSAWARTLYSTTAIPGWSSMVRHAQINFFCRGAPDWQVSSSETVRSLQATGWVKRICA